MAYAIECNNETAGVLLAEIEEENVFKSMFGPKTTSLMLAINYQNRAFIKHLMKYSEKLDSYNRTALMWAAEYDLQSV